MMKKMFKGLCVFGSFTLVSRALGFMRDFLMAHTLGAGTISDVFFVAFRFPNLFRAVLAEGALSSSIVPIYLENLASKDRAINFANNMFLFLTVILLVVCIIAQLFMPFFITLLSLGFVSNPMKFDNAVLLSRIMFPYLFFISLTAFMGALMQAHKSFAAFSTCPIILNLCLIATLLYFEQDYAYVLSYAVLISGLLQFIWMYLSVRASGVKLQLGHFRVDNDIRTFVKRFIPAMLGMSMGQIAIFIDTLFASLFSGVISFFYYADRLIQLPLALIGISLNTVSFPLIAECIKKNDIQGAINLQNDALRVGLLFSIPASVALITLSESIVRGLFLYGAFDFVSAANTADILCVLGFALPAFVLHKVFITVFFSIGDTKTPALYSIYSLVINIILKIILIYFYGYIGIAVATVIGAWVNTLCIVRKLIRLKLYSLDPNLKNCFFHIFYASCVMMIVTQVVDLFFSTLLIDALWFAKVVVVVMLGVFGMLSYFGTYFLIKKLSRSSVKKLGYLGH